MNLKLSIKQRTRLVNYHPNISMETTIMKTEDSKTNESHKFVLDLTQVFDLQSSNKHVTFQNLSIYYTSKNIDQRYIYNKLKIIALMWNDEFQLL